MSAHDEPARDKLILAVIASSLFFATALWAGGRFTSVWLTTGLAAGCSIAACIFVDAPRVLRLLVPTQRSVIIGVVAGIAMAGATYALYSLSAAWVPGLRTEVNSLYRALHDPPGVAYALPVLLLVVLAEEIVWRGVLYDAMPRRLGPEVRVVCGALLYALPQLGKGSPVLLLVAFVCGLLWGTERVWTRGLVAPLITHIVWDLLLFVIAPLE